MSTISAPHELIPVMLPPGFASVRAIPISTGLSTEAATIGTVRVTFCAASVAAGNAATRTSGALRISSAARLGNASFRPSAERTDRTNVVPST